MIQLAYNNGVLPLGFHKSTVSKKSLYLTPLADQVQFSGTATAEAKPKVPRMLVKDLIKHAEAGHFFRSSIKYDWEKKLNLNRKVYPLNKTNGEEIFFISPQGYKYFNKKDKTGIKAGQFSEYYYLAQFEPETCLLKDKDQLAETVRAHDYNQIYSGSLDAKFKAWKYDFILDCLDYRTDKIIANSLTTAFSDIIDPEHAIILDVAAGTGKQLGHLLTNSKNAIQNFIAVDPSIRARVPALTEGLYSKYYSVTPSDFLKEGPLGIALRENLWKKKGFKPNVLVISAGLEKQGHLKPSDLMASFVLLAGGRNRSKETKNQLPGIFCFSINKEVYKNNRHPVMKILKGLKDNNLISIFKAEEYKHRNEVSGQPLKYYLVYGCIEPNAYKNDFNAESALFMARLMGGSAIDYYNTRQKPKSIVGYYFKLKNSGALDRYDKAYKRGKQTVT